LVPPSRTTYCLALALDPCLLKNLVIVMASGKTSALAPTGMKDDKWNLKEKGKKGW
jgi:hypothetical protein